MWKKKAVVWDVCWSLKKTVKKFEETCSFEVKFRKGRKSVFSKSIEDMSTALQKGTSSGVQMCSAHNISRSLHIPPNTVHKFYANPALLFIQKYPCSGFISCWSTSKTYFCSIISCSHGSGLWMAMEYILDRWSLFLCLRFSQNSNLQSIGSKIILALMLDSCQNTHI